MLVKKPPSLEKREENNKKNSPKTIFLVFLLFFTFSYLFSNLWEVINIPSPEDLFKNLISIELLGVYDDDGNLQSNVYMYLSNNIHYKNDPERLIFFSLIAMSFLSTYLLPVKYKKISMVTFAIIIITLIFGLKAISGLLLMHLIIFSFLHQKNSKEVYLSLFIGMLFPLIFVDFKSITSVIFLLPVSSILSYFIFEKIIYPILNIKNSKIPYFLKILVLQSPMITCLILPFVNLFNTDIIKISIGILMFFWQWERIMMYQIDYDDGAIPENITIIEYLSIFINPSVISNWNWGASIAQGYTYSENNFLSKDKNILAIEGIKISLIALFYLIFGFHLIKTLSTFINNFFGIYVYIDVYSMVLDFSNGKEMSTFTVLLSTFIGQVKWFLVFGGVVHLRVGLWRLHGYNIDSYFNKPWLATNLANFWVRYTYHYREFLFRVFYYPFFSRFFKENMTLRVFSATLFSLTIGNFFWGHFTEEMFYKGFKVSNFKMIETIPYYLLLGLGISLTQIYLLNKKNNKRKPWTKDKLFFLDILCAYLTFQSYSLIHIFARPVENGNFFMYGKLFLIGLGIHLPR